MARSRDKKLKDTLRARGLRTRTATLVSDTVSAGRKRSRGSERATLDVVSDLRRLADEVEKRIKGTKGAQSKSQRRSEAAKKAVRTRARNAAARKRSAQKAAMSRKSKQQK